MAGILYVIFTIFASMLCFLMAFTYDSFIWLWLCMICTCLFFAGIESNFRKNGKISISTTLLVTFAFYFVFFSYIMPMNIETQEFEDKCAYIEINDMSQVYFGESTAPRSMDYYLLYSDSMNKYFALEIWPGDFSMYNSIVDRLIEDDSGNIQLYVNDRQLNDTAYGTISNPVVATDFMVDGVNWIDVYDEIMYKSSESTEMYHDKALRYYCTYGRYYYFRIDGHIDIWGILFSKYSVKSLFYAVMLSILVVIINVLYSRLYIKLMGRKKHDTKKMLDTVSHDTNTDGIHS